MHSSTTVRPSTRVRWRDGQTLSDHPGEDSLKKRGTDENLRKPNSDHDTLRLLASRMGHHDPRTRTHSHSCFIEPRAEQRSFQLLVKKARNRFYKVCC